MCAPNYLNYTLKSYFRTHFIDNELNAVHLQHLVGIRKLSVCDSAKYINETFDMCMEISGKKCEAFGTRNGIGSNGRQNVQRK